MLLLFGCNRFNRPSLFTNPLFSLVEKKENVVCVQAIIGHESSMDPLAAGEGCRFSKHVSDVAKYREETYCVQQEGGRRSFGSGQIFERANFLPVQTVYTEPPKFCSRLQYSFHEPIQIFA